MTTSDSRPRSLREACVTAAHQVIAEQGIEHLSLRDVARRLGVSHQAPYRHFASRDHLLAEVIRRCFQQFAATLQASLDPGADGMEAMQGLGEAYLEFALSHPLEYRLMFGTPWPAEAATPELVSDARMAFDVLRSALARTYGPSRADKVDADAMLIWSTMHGLASILQGNLMQHLPLTPQMQQGLAGHVMMSIDELIKTRLPSVSAKRS